MAGSCRFGIEAKTLDVYLFNRSNNKGSRIPAMSSIPPRPQSPRLPLSITIPVRVIMISPNEKMSENQVHHFPGL